MVEWNGIFHLFRFFGIFGQPREVHSPLRAAILFSGHALRTERKRTTRSLAIDGKALRDSHAKIALWLTFQSDNEKL